MESCSIQRASYEISILFYQERDIFFKKESSHLTILNMGRCKKLRLVALN